MKVVQLAHGALNCCSLISTIYEVYVCSRRGKKKGVIVVAEINKEIEDTKKYYYVILLNIKIKEYYLTWKMF